jgi:ferredoxin
MTKQVAVNFIECVGHGICAELLPERITLDDWGYPVIDPKPLPSNLEKHARRAVAACPALALLLRDVKESQRSEPTADQKSFRRRLS